MTGPPLRGTPSPGGHGPIVFANPGTDEIAISMPLGNRHCACLDHGIVGTQARVVVRFGPLSPRGRTVLFAGCARRSYPLCAECWDATRQLAHTHHISLIIPATTWP
jgi:hypothetical protein